MSKIKLEVGKTYRNRKGEEVRIVRKTANGRPPFQGSDGEWYTENGRWQYFGAKFPEDLIEEVEETQHTFALVTEALTATQYTFTIPEGTKGVNVSKEGNRIIVEMVPEKEPKPGDVLVNRYGGVYILKADEGKERHEHYAWLGTNGVLNIGAWCTPGRPATAEEAQPLFDALKKAGKRWDPETMQVEEVPEAPKPGDVMVNHQGSVYIFKEVVDSDTHKHYAWLGKDERLETGTSCIPGRPATPEEAKPLFDALKKAGKRWNPETMEVEGIPEIDRIREWVWANLKSDLYDKSYIAEAIEAYLNHKEGEK